MIEERAREEREVRIGRREERESEQVREVEGRENRRKRARERERIIREADTTACLNVPTLDIVVSRWNKYLTGSPQIIHEYEGIPEYVKFIEVPVVFLLSRFLPFYYLLQRYSIYLFILVEPGSFGCQAIRYLFFPLDHFLFPSSSHGIIHPNPFTCHKP